jgi:hypothetical protein
MNRTTMSLEFIADEASRPRLIGKAKGDEVARGSAQGERVITTTWPACWASTTTGSTSWGNFLFRIAEIKRMVPLNWGQDLFDRVYGKDAVADEAGFRAKVKEGLESMFRRDSDRIFKRLVMKKPCNEGSISNLPDAFLKRWILETSQKPITRADRGELHGVLRRPEAPIVGGPQ